jgi:hypothetical protein
VRFRFAYQQHAAAAARSTYVDFGEPSARLEWDVRTGTRSDGRGAGLAVHSQRAVGAVARVVIVGAPTSWSARDGPFVELTHTVASAAATATVEAGASCGEDSVELRVYFLRAGQRVFPADAGAHRAVRRAGAAGNATTVGEFSNEQSASARIALPCSGREPVAAVSRVHLGSAPSYVGECVQMELVLEALAEFWLDIASVRFVTA